MSHSCTFRVCSAAMRSVMGVEDGCRVKNRYFDFGRDFDFGFCEAKCKFKSTHFVPCVKKAQSKNKNSTDHLLYPN